MISITESGIIQLFNTTVNAGILIAVVKATRAVTRLEFKVEMMWNLFARNIGMPEFKDK